MFIFRNQANCGMPQSSESPPGQNRLKKVTKATISGAITGSLEICVTYPTEYVKTMQQLYKHFQKQGAVKCASDTIKEHGIFGLYRGFTCLLCFSIPKMAVRFGSKDLYDNTIFTSRNRTNTFFSGMCAGATEGIIVVTPQETVKTKIIHDRLRPDPKFRGFLHGMSVIYKKEGFKGIYKGPAATVMKQASNQAIRFLIYDDMRKLIDKFMPNAPLPVKTVIAGGIAGAGSVIGNTPVDVVKTNLQGLEAHKYRGTLDCTKQIWLKEGFLGFYKGVGPRMTRVVIDVALTFTFFESIKKALDYFWP